MPKFRIVCSTVVQYTLVVDAPSRDAVEEFYDACDGGEFNRSDEAVGWELDELYETAPDEPADVTVDEAGKVVDA